MTTDPGHLLPPEAWRAVVADAELEAQRIAAGTPAPEAPVEHGFASGLLPLSGVVTAARHGGSRPAPTFGVLHSAETPLRAGYAAAVARMFATTTADKSCHYMTDPAETWGVLDDRLVAWHCGTGNTNSIGLEQAGYAATPRAEWLTADGYAQMRRNAAIMRAARDRYGIALRWMTDAELLAAHRRQIVGGWATHDQCRRVLGGTSHTDPTPGFPLDVQMSLATSEAPIDEDDDVALVDEVAELRRIVGVLAGWPGAATAGEVLAQQGPAHAEESRRMLGVILGWQPPATDGERAALERLYGSTPPDVDEQAIAAALAPILLTRLDTISSSDLARIATAVADENARRVQA